jgi:hypothetical protein
MLFKLVLDCLPHEFQRRAENAILRIMVNPVGINQHFVGILVGIR